MNANDLDRRAKLRQFKNALITDLVRILGNEHRDELERMSVEQLMRTKGRTMSELMQPGPSAA